MSHSFDVC